MLRIVQAGMGAMGAGWSDCVAASPDFQAVAYVDPNRKQMLAVAGRHGMPRNRCFSSLQEALQKVEADAVLDVTPQEVRKEICTTAFDHGLHVLAEKPLADNVRTACSLVNRARRSNCRFVIAQNYRYQAETQTVRSIIEKNKLGTIGYFGVEFHKGPRFGGFREKMAYPLILDMAIHHVDLMRFFLGRDIVAVQARSIAAPWNWFKGDAAVSANLEFEGGATGNYFSSWVARGAETTWNGTWRIEGSEGVLVWDGTGIYLSDHPDRRRKQRLVAWSGGSQAHLLAAFARSIATGEEAETCGARNLNSLGATWAMVRAAKTAAQVRVADVLR